jgi:hypothetical protein
MRRRQSHAAKIFLKNSDHVSHFVKIGCMAQAADSLSRARSGNMAQNRAMAPRPMKMGTIALPWHYDAQSVTRSNR